jgi:hypothetical protein
MQETPIVASVPNFMGPLGVTPAASPSGMERYIWRLFALLGRSWAVTIELDNSSLVRKNE